MRNTAEAVLEALKSLLFVTGVTRIDNSSATHLVTAYLVGEVIRIDVKPRKK